MVFVSMNAQEVHLKTSKVLVANIAIQCVRPASVLIQMNVKAVKLPLSGITKPLSTFSILRKKLATKPALLILINLPAKTFANLVVTTVRSVV